MTEISGISPNEEEQEQEISIREFMKTQKQLMENMQLMFQKHATATSTPRSSGLRTDENNSNHASQQYSHDRPIHENIPRGSRKRKRVLQVNQNSQDTATLQPSDSDSYLSEDSICQRKDSEDPLSKYSNVGSDVEIEGDQDNSCKDLLASVQEDFGPSIDTKLADVLERIWGKAKLGDSQKVELKNTLIPDNYPFMKTLLNPEMYNKVNDTAKSRDKGAKRKQRLLFKSTIPLVKAVVALKGLEHDAQDKIPSNTKRKLQDVYPLPYKSLPLNNTMFTEIQRKSDICQSLGKKFKPYAKSDSSKDYLFDEKTKKRMNQDLKTIQDRYRSKTFYQSSKNWGGSYKTQKSRSHRGKSK